MFARQGGADGSIGVRAGHWTDLRARTGCTVILFDRPAPAVADVRGGAPGTRETDLLGPGQLVRTVDAVLLTGGSAFGLDASAGVMAFLRNRGQGVSTSAGPIPIVAAAVLFDLSVGEPTWPTADHATSACQAAVSLDQLERGAVGAGAGATTRKVFPDLEPLRGGLGIARVDLGDTASVTAVAAVNAAGEVVSESGNLDRRASLVLASPPELGREATTLVAVLIDAPVDDRSLRRAAAAAHDGVARMIRPSHTIFDGDTVFAVGLQAGEVNPASILRYSIAVELAVERAIIDAVNA